MTVDLAALAKLAAEATPGPLTLVAYQHGGGRLHRENVLVADFYNERDRDFHYAASPDVVAALIRDLRQSRIAMEEIRAYARHSPLCAYAPTYPDAPEATCDCGFDVALRVYGAALADLDA